MKKILLLIIGIVFICSLNAKDLHFGIYTSDKPSTMYKKFKPVIDYLESELNKKGLDYQIKLKIYPDYDEAIDALVKGEYDFARFGPASYIIANNKNPKLKLLVMEHKKNKKRFDGVFIVKANSNIEKVEDIKGKTFAFGNEKSTIGRYLAQAKLLEAGITSKDLKSFEYLGRHDKVALAVANGQYDVGVVKDSTFKKYQDRGLKVIDKFENVTKPWLVRESLPNELFVSLQNALLDLKDKEILKIFKEDGFIKTDDSEYDFVRRGMNASLDF